MFYTKYCGKFSEQKTDLQKGMWAESVYKLAVEFNRTQEKWFARFLKANIHRLHNETSLKIKHKNIF